MACPLCDCESSRPSWLGSTRYLGKDFDYVQCDNCKSLYCFPMPEAEVLASMYGPEYGSSFSPDPMAEGRKDRERVLNWLRKYGTGLFIDYGCGMGNLLTEAKRMGWDALGVEFDEEVAKSAEAQTGIRVLTATQLNSLDTMRADVLHLGDVLEHLTDLNHQVPMILNLLKPGGLLIAQGPLEANANLFFYMVRLIRVLRRKPLVEMAPYHVLLATLGGQKQLFKRFGLSEIEFQITEVSWPAPDRISLAALSNLRFLTMYAIRRISQTVSAICPHTSGNRYFYIGRRG